MTFDPAKYTSRGQMANALAELVDRRNDVVYLSDYILPADVTADDHAAALNRAADAARLTGGKLVIDERATAYRITAQVDLREIRRIECSTAGLSVASAFAGTAVKIGSATLNAMDLEIGVVRETSDWTTGNVGVEVVGLQQSVLKVHKTQGFERGLFLNSSEGPITCSKIYHTYYYGNKVHLWVRSAAPYFNTENLHVGGYFATASQVGGVDARAPIVLEADGQNCSEQKFLSPIFEVNNGVMVAECVYTTAHLIDNNVIDQARVEGVGSSTSTQVVKLTGNFTAGTAVEVAFNSLTDDLLAVMDVGIPTDTRASVKVTFASNAGYLQSRRGGFSVRGFPYQVTATEANVAGLVGFDINTFQRAQLHAGVTAAYGNGLYNVSSSYQVYGVYVTKSTGFPMFLSVPGTPELELAIICWDSSGNQLSGTSPYYAKGSQHNQNSIGGHPYYQVTGSFVWIHPSVHRFFIAPHSRNTTWEVGAWEVEVLMGLDWQVQFGPTAIIASEYPKQSYHPKGTFVANTAASSIGWVTSSRVDTAVTATASAGNVNLTVASTAGILAADVIGVELNDLLDAKIRRMHWTTVASVTNGTVLVLTDAIPTGKSVAIGRGVFTNRWAAFSGGTIS